jgi:hypothetical protein
MQQDFQNILKIFEGNMEVAKDETVHIYIIRFLYQNGRIRSGSGSTTMSGMI